MVTAQHPLIVRRQLLADRDRLRRAFTQLDKVIEREEPEPQQKSGQLLVGLALGPRRIIQQRRHLLRDIPGGLAIVRSRKRRRARLQH